MKRNKRLQKLGNEINDTFFKGKLNDVFVYSVNTTNKKEAKDFKKRWDGWNGNKIAGLSCPNTGIIINLGLCWEDTFTEYYTLVHEYIHQWQDLKGLDSDKKPHGKHFMKKMYKIGKKLGMSKKETRKKIL